MEEFIQGGDRAVYQGFFQKLEREKRLPEQDKAYLKEKNPELYEMVESLEMWFQRGSGGTQRVL